MSFLQQALLCLYHKNLSHATHSIAKGNLILPIFFPFWLSCVMNQHHRPSKKTPSQQTTLTTSSLFLLPFKITTCAPSSYYFSYQSILITHLPYFFIFFTFTQNFFPFNLAHTHTFSVSLDLPSTNLTCS